MESSTFTLESDLQVPKSNAFDFRILHLSSSHTGGAGIAARRLSSSLNSIGVDSLFVALHAPGYFPSSREFAVKRRFPIRLVSIMAAVFAKVTFRRTYFTLFSKQSISLADIRSFGQPDNTIIQIHNWFNFMNVSLMRGILEDGYRIIFTLHDQRIFTGGCHYSLSCEKFKESCSNCPELPPILDKLPKVILNCSVQVFQKHIGQIACISPSLWLKEIAQESTLLKSIPIYHVRNVHPISLDSDKIWPIQESNKIILGIASIDRFSYLKGFANVNLLQEFLISQRFPFEMRFLNDYINQESGGELFWSEIDVLLVLSNADNSPNVIHEAKIHGVPIIGSNVGGIPELLNKEYDFCTNLDLQMPERVMEFLNQVCRLNKDHIKERIRNDYLSENEHQLEEYMSIYQNLAKIWKLNSK